MRDAIGIALLSYVGEERTYLAMLFRRDATLFLSVRSQILKVRRISINAPNLIQEESFLPISTDKWEWLYVPPEIQEDWRHAIRKQPETGGRISLTFRQVA